MLIERPGGKSTGRVAGCAEVRVVSNLGAVFFSPISESSFHAHAHAHAHPSFLPRFLPSFLFIPSVSVSLPACCSLIHLALHLPHVSPAYLVTLLFLFLPPPSSSSLLFLPPPSSRPLHAPPYLLHRHNPTHSAKTYLIIPHLDITIISALRNESVVLVRSRGKSRFRAVAITAQMMNGVSTIRFTPCKSPAN